MNLRWAAVTTATALLFGAATASAQWPEYPTVGVPLTSEGEPDLEAPAPRLSDGNPDFSGVWAAGRGFGGGRGGRGRGDGPGDGAAATPPPEPDDTPPRAAFFDIFSNYEGEPPFQPWARELRAQREADNMKDNPDAHCLPMGHMQFHLHPQPRKFIHRPEILVILYEGNGGVRQIFTDGRELPDPDTLFPWWYGYSVGHWEGDTLVVETIKMKDDGWLDVNGSPFTSSGRIIERFTRTSVGTMEIDITIDDPTAYTQPFTVRVDHRLLPGEELIEFVCIENEKSSYLYDP